MKMDHKDVPTQMTKQEKLLAEEYRKGESREEKDRRAKETWEKVWTEYAASKKSNNKRLKKVDKGRKGELQPHRPEKKQNVLREMTKMRTKITYPQKNQAARTQRMSQPKRSSREPTRKATSKLYFVRNVFSLAGQN